MHTKAVEDLLARIPASGCASQIWDAATGFFGAFGLDRIIYLDAGPARERVMTTMPESWQAHYVERNLARVDPFLRYCASTMAPIGTGIEYLESHSYLDRRERGFIAEAAESGFRAGLTCIARVKGPTGAAGWNLGSTMRRSRLEKLVAEQGQVLRLAAHYCHEKLSRTETESDSRRPGLSPREAESLQWLAAGLRIGGIAERMGIRPVTVELHLRNARIKLGARTREQALARALKSGAVRI